MSTNGDGHARPHGRVLVTGATGFLGTSLVSRLLREGVPVRALARTQARAADLASRGAEPVVGDLSNEIALEGALKDITVVYHLAGKLFEPAASPDEYRRTHVDGTRALLEGCRRQRGLERFVHCSTTGVLGVTGDEPADERAAVHPTNVYESTKAEAESLVSVAMEEGLPAVIARPGLVYGPADLHLLTFFRTVAGRRFRPIGRVPTLLHPIYVDDMTEAFLRCGRCPTAVGECFHFAGREPVSLEGLAAAIAEGLDTTMPRGRIPLPAARALATVGDSLPGRLKRSAPLTTSRLDFLTHSRVYRVDKASRLLDFVARTDLRTGIEQTVAWYRACGYLPQ